MKQHSVLDIIAALPICALGHVFSSERKSELRFHETLTVDQNYSSDQFLITLLNLMKEKSFFDISISELCHTAGLSRTTFYKFFQDKDALLDYLAEDLSLGFVAYKKAFKSTIFLVRRSPLSTIFLSGIKFGNGSMFL